MPKKRWKKVVPINPKKLHIGCLNCSSARLEAPLNMRVDVGFGFSAIYKDGKAVLDCERFKRGVRVRRAENMAAKDPDHDWRIVRMTPLHGETYQRHGDKKWVCIESNQGFA